MRSIKESAVRNRARTKGYLLRKLRENSRDYPQHGPFLLLDARRNWMVASGLSLEQAAEAIEGL